jgi:hypothetical protein
MAITRKGQRIERAARGILVAGAAGVRDDDGDDAEIGGVARGGLDADFGRDADDGDGCDGAVAQRHFERRALEGGHRKLVEDRFA